METVTSEVVEQTSMQGTQFVVDTIIHTPNSKDDEHDAGDGKEDPYEGGDPLLEPFRQRHFRRASFVIPTFENSESFMEGLERSVEDPMFHQQAAMREGDLLEPFQSRDRSPYAMKSIWRSLPYVSLSCVSIPNVSWPRVSWPSGPPTQEILVPERKDYLHCQEHTCETLLLQQNEKSEFDKFKQDMQSANKHTVNRAHQAMQNVLVNICNANYSRGHSPVRRNGNWQSHSLSQNTIRESVLEVTNISSNAFAHDNSDMIPSSRLSISSSAVSKSLNPNHLGSSSSLLQSCKGKLLVALMQVDHHIQLNISERHINQKFG